MEAAPKEAEALDLELLAELVGVRAATGTDVFSNFLERVRSGKALSVSLLHAAVANADTKAVLAQCHLLKGTAAAFGLKRVAAMASFLHDRAERSESVLPADIDVLARTIAVDVEILGTYLASQP
jgi:HPt (histidine-containing phosphotransfer) domain-containing protein